MPGSMTDYLENKILEHTLGKVAYPMPTIYAGLLTAVPTEGGSLSEIIGAGYSRATVTFGSANGGEIKNAQNISFPAAIANWGTIVAVGLFDSQTPGIGNLLWYGSLDTAKNISTNDQFVIPTQALIITLD